MSANEVSDAVNEAMAWCEIESERLESAAEVKTYWESIVVRAHEKIREAERPDRQVNRVRLHSKNERTT